ncbi:MULTISPECIES: hypothetical protein [Dolichospermum]|uniref:Transposase n=1 Tax=Dolichospermum heterosporum TAC447 TaxID=747523 RepID=A0ABY5LSH3_9CYAN|nr:MULTISPECIES: hypothetical protein [Dolichospermum]MDK2411908.1 hypothetical protein [Aphanizomenon sp. 202]MDK2462592.1 hypothetical protein [Aphanizomenon sp. PH219]UUO13513.1 hypothetical protein NG743_15635 [Dolichospermum heterosporum TAC447]
MPRYAISKPSLKLITLTGLQSLFCQFVNRKFWRSLKLDHFFKDVKKRK